LSGHVSDFFKTSDTSPELDSLHHPVLNSFYCVEMNKKLVSAVEEWNVIFPLGSLSPVISIKTTLAALHSTGTYRILYSTLRTQLHVHYSM
jgi:hypothetical protein